MTRLKDISGTKYKTFEVLRPDSAAAYVSGRGKGWVCRCKCGKEFIVHVTSYVNEDSNRCTCSLGRKYWSRVKPNFSIKAMAARYRTIVRRYPTDQILWTDLDHFLTTVKPVDGARYLSRADVNKPWGPDNYQWFKTREEMLSAKDVVVGDQLKPIMQVVRELAAKENLSFTKVKELFDQKPFEEAFAQAVTEPQLKRQRRSSDSPDVAMIDLALKLSKEHGLNYQTVHRRLKAANGEVTDRVVSKKPLLTNLRDHRFTYQGRELSLKEWSEETGITMCDLSRRMFKLKWTIDRAINTPVVRRRTETKLYLYKGKLRTLTSLAVEAKLPITTLKARLSRLNWSVEKAMSTPLKSEIIRNGSREH